jgi:hypothetical protein
MACRPSPLIESAPAVRHARCRPANQWRKPSGLLAGLLLRIDDREAESVGEGRPAGAVIILVRSLVQPCSAMTNGALAAVFGSVEEHAKVAGICTKPGQFLAAVSARGRGLGESEPPSFGPMQEDARICFEMVGYGQKTRGNPASEALLIALQHIVVQCNMVPPGDGVKNATTHFGPNARGATTSCAVLVSIGVPMDTADTFKMNPRLWCGDLNLSLRCLCAPAPDFENRGPHQQNFRDEAPEIVRKNGGKLPF